MKEAAEAGSPPGDDVLDSCLRLWFGTRPGAPSSGEPDGRRYELLEPVGRGGMGVVFRARDKLLDREIALKFLLDEHRDSTAMRTRFEREAKICATLQHPGVVPLLDLGQGSDGRPFLAMKLVRGRALAEHLHEGKDRAQLLSAFEQVCHTIAHAHAHGIVHCDLKPANIMVGAFGDVQVMDWGIARRTGEESGIGLAGTRGYAAPEQTCSGDVDARTDVFALGAILAELLTGEPVSCDIATFRGAVPLFDLAEVYGRLQRCSGPRALTALAEECLRLDPDERPADASALAQRVGEYRSSAESERRSAELEAEKANARAEAERRGRRRVLTAAGVVVVLMAVLVVAWSELRVAQADRKATQTATYERMRGLYSRMAAVALQIGARHPQSALYLYEHLYDDSPIKREIAEPYADLLAENGRLARALNILIDASKWHTSEEVAARVAARIAEIEQRLEAEQTTDAEPIVLAANEEPTDPSGWLRLGERHYADARYEEALLAFTRATELPPVSMEAHHARGEALRKLGRYLEATGAYSEVIRLADGPVLGSYLRRQLLVANGMTGPELVEFERASIDSAGDPSEAWRHLGIAAHMCRDYELAESAFSRACALAPGRHVPLQHLAWALTGLRRYDEALAICKRERDVYGSQNHNYRQFDTCEALVRFSRQFPTAPPRESWPTEGPGARANMNRLALLCYHRGELQAALEIWEHMAEQGRLNHPFSAVAAAVQAFPADPTWLATGRGWLEETLDNKRRGWRSEPQRRWRYQDDMTYLLLTPLLASVREPRLLAALPKAERVAWSAIWDRVRMMLRAMLADDL